MRRTACAATAVVLAGVACQQDRTEPRAERKDGPGSGASAGSDAPATPPADGARGGGPAHDGAAPARDAPRDAEAQPPRADGTLGDGAAGADGALADGSASFRPPVPAPGGWAPTMPAPVARSPIGNRGIWTGSELIVWGEIDADIDDGGPAWGRFNYGEAYDPETGRWRIVEPEVPNVSPPPRDWTRLVWTGTEMIVWGGRRRGGSFPNAGTLYDPARDLWRRIPCPGAPDPCENAPAGRYYHSAVWTGSEMVVWAGFWGLMDSVRSDGGAYDPTTDGWRMIADEGAPSPRIQHVEVWTGWEMIVWGGASDVWLGDGGAYDPAGDTWRPIGGEGAPSARAGATAVWTGSEMLVWGGLAPDRGSSAGAAYDPATDRWRPMATDGAPSGRLDHAAVWTGREMIVWGGFGGGAVMNDGAMYDPASDVWTPTPAEGAPAPRRLMAAVWTGSDLLVHGGSRTDITVLHNDGGRFRPR